MQKTVSRIREKKTPPPLKPRGNRKEKQKTNGPQFAGQMVIFSIFPTTFHLKDKRKG